MCAICPVCLSSNNDKGHCGQPNIFHWWNDLDCLTKIKTAWCRLSVETLLHIWKFVLSTERFYWKFDFKDLLLLCFSKSNCICFQLRFRSGTRQQRKRMCGMLALATSRMPQKETIRTMCSLVNPIIINCAKQSIFYFSYFLIFFCILEILAALSGGINPTWKKIHRNWCRWRALFYAPNHT